jgi:hypothetical protein
MTRQKTLIYVFTAAFCFAIFLLHAKITETSIYSDGRFYYATTRSLVKDYDIKFANEYRYLNMQTDFTNETYVWNMYPPGAPILWSFLFWQTDNVMMTLEKIGLGVDTSGFSIIYQSSVAISGIILGLLGIYLIYHLLTKYFGKRASFLASMALLFTTNLFFYVAVEPVNSHAVSFFTSALFTYYFLHHKKERYYYFLLGVLGGFAGLVRTQDLLILTLPALQLLIKHLLNSRKNLHSLFQLGGGAALAFSPQIIFWKKIFNTFWYSPYIDYGFNFIKPKILHVLFNTQNGLFLLTPIVGVSFIASFFLGKKLNNIKFYAIFYFLLQLYLVSSWNYYTQGGSYSIRMMITTYPLLAFGIAKVIQKCNGLFAKSLTLISIGLFSAANFAAIILYLWRY